MIDILTKQREPLEDLEVTCTGEQLPDPPYTFTCIHLHYQAKGAVNQSHLILPSLNKTSGVAKLSEVWLV